MGYSGRLGGVMRQYLMRKLSHESNCVTTAAPAAFVVSRGMASSKLFVGGLTWGTDEEALRDAFSSYGNLTDVKVITDRDTGRSRGFGFVGFTSDAEAESALKAMDGQSLAGRTIRVNYAHSPANGPRGGGMSRGFGLGAGRGSFGSDFASNASFGRSSEQQSNRNESFGQSLGGFDNQHEGHGRSSGGFGEDGGRLSSSGRFGHEAESFEGRSEAGNRQQGSFDFDSFGGKGESTGFGAASFRTSSDRFGGEVGSMGQRSGGRHMESAYSQNFPAFRKQGHSGGNFEDLLNHEKDFSVNRPGFGGNSKANVEIDDEPSSSLQNDENSERFNANLGVGTHRRFERNGWRGIENAGLNNAEGFVRSSGSLEHDFERPTGSWKSLENDNSSSGNHPSGSTNWRESPNGSFDDWAGPSNALHDTNQPVEREYGPGREDWKNEGNGKGPTSADWRGS